MARKKKEETTKEEFKVKKISPFDIINFIFTNDEEFSKLSDMILDQNFFIINRVFSIKYPLQAQAFNTSGISTANVIKCWKNFLNMKEGKGRVPYWCYTKGTKRAQEQKDSKSEIKSSDIKTYAEFYNISLRDTKVYADICPELFLGDVEKINLRNSAREQEKQISKVK